MIDILRELASIYGINDKEMNDLLKDKDTSMKVVDNGKTVVDIDHGVNKLTGKAIAKPAAKPEDDDNSFVIFHKPDEPKDCCKRSPKDLDKDTVDYFATVNHINGYSGTYCYKKFVDNIPIDENATLQMAITDKDGVRIPGLSWNQLVYIVKMEAAKRGITSIAL